MMFCKVTVGTGKAQERKSHGESKTPHEGL